MFRGMTPCNTIAMSSFLSDFDTGVNSYTTTFYVVVLSEMFTEILLYSSSKNVNNFHKHIFGGFHLLVKV